MPRVPLGPAGPERGCGKKKTLSQDWWIVLMAGVMDLRELRARKAQLGVQREMAVLAGRSFYTMSEIALCR